MKRYRDLMSIFSFILKNLIYASAFGRKVIKYLLRQKRKLFTYGAKGEQKRQQILILFINKAEASISKNIMEFLTCCSLKHLQGSAKSSSFFLLPWPLEFTYYL